MVASKYDGNKLLISLRYMNKLALKDDNTSFETFFHNFHANVILKTRIYEDYVALKSDNLTDKTINEYVDYVYFLIENSQCVCYTLALFTLAKYGDRHFPSATLKIASKIKIKANKRIDDEDLFVTKLSQRTSKFNLAVLSSRSKQYELTKFFLEHNVSPTVFCHFLDINQENRARDILLSSQNSTDYSFHLAFYWMNEPHKFFEFLTKKDLSGEHVLCPISVFQHSGEEFLKLFMKKLPLFKEIKYNSAAFEGYTEDSFLEILMRMSCSKELFSEILELFSKNNINFQDSDGVISQFILDGVKLCFKNALYDDSKNDKDPFDLMHLAAERLRWFVEFRPEFHIIAEKVVMDIKEDYKTHINLHGENTSLHFQDFKKNWDSLWDFVYIPMIKGGRKSKKLN